MSFGLLADEPLLPLLLAGLAGLGGRAGAQSGAMREKIAAVRVNRTARRSGDRPNGERTGRATQNGMRIRM